MLALGLALCGACAYAVYARPAAGGIFVVRAAGRVSLFPLDADETVTVQGPLGPTVLALRERSARALSSPCANKTCIAAGSISRAGEWLACLPNEVIVTVEAGRGGPPDAVDAGAW
jgi:hypothetical protein